MKAHSYLQRFEGVELAVRQRGKGIPLIWGHNLLGSIRVDDKVGIWRWPEIEKHAHLVRYDARGHGNSDGSYQPGDYRWDNLAGDMLSVAQSVAEAKGADRYVLGGASMGCSTALEAAIQEPEKVAGLILVLPPTAWRTRARQARKYRRQAWVSGAFGATPYRMLKFLPDETTHEDARRRLSLTTARELAMANPLHVQAALQGAALSNLPSKRALRELDIPTIIFSWRGDSSHPESTAKILADTLPNVQSFTTSSAHDIDDWTKDVCAFLDTLSGRRRRKSAA
ncbi:MAG: alpha/beta hydrolase [Halioglobus sp.]